MARQPVFFVATAAPDARINLSPKGYDAFRVLAPDRVAWLDLGGSGNETNAHLLADGRITIMFCNFEQPALILRIYGRGRPVLPADADWEELAGHFTLLPGTRSEEHTSELQSLMRISYAVFCLKKKNKKNEH